MIHHLLIQPLNYLYSQLVRDRGTKCLTYIGNVTVNGFPGIEKKKRPVFTKPRIPKLSMISFHEGTKQILGSNRCRWSSSMD